MGNAFKRTILDMITNELLQHASDDAEGSKFTLAAEVATSAPQNSGLAAARSISTEGRRRHTSAVNLLISAKQTGGRSLHSGSEANRLLNAYRLFNASGGHPPMARVAHRSTGAGAPLPDRSAFGLLACGASLVRLGEQQPPDACPTCAPPRGKPVTVAGSKPAPPSSPSLAPPSDQSIHQSTGSFHTLQHYASLMLSVSSLRKKPMSRVAKLEEAVWGSSRGFARPSLDGKSDSARSSLDWARDAGLLPPKGPSSPPGPGFGASPPAPEMWLRQEATPTL